MKWVWNEELNTALRSPLSLLIVFVLFRLMVLVDIQRCTQVSVSYTHDSEVNNIVSL